MNIRRRIDNDMLEKLRLEEGWFSFFALLLAFMTVVWSIQGANWADGSAIFPRIALVGLFVGFGLAKVRFVPTLLAHSFMLSVGMVYVGFMVAPYGDPRYTEWTQKLGSTVLRVVRWIEGAIGGNAHDDNLVCLALLGFGLWILGYTAAWMLFRSHRVWLTLLLLGATLMVNLSFNPPNAIFSFTFFLLVSLLLVVRFSAYMDEQRWRSLRLYFQPGLWRNAMMVGGCLALVVVAVAFATPSSSQIDSWGQVLNNVSQPFNGVKGIWDSVGSGGTDGGGKVAARSKNNYNSLDDSFTIGGPLRLSNDPVIRVTEGSNIPPIYMQAKTMDFYDGKGWINTYQLPGEAQQNDETVFRRLSLAANQSLPSPTDKGRGTSKLNVTSLVPGYNPVLSLGDLVSADRNSLVAFHYEKVDINAPLDAFKLKDIPDGDNGKRSVLVDTTTGKVVPPSVLDLLKDLKDGAQQSNLALPPTTLVTYTQRGNRWMVGIRYPSGRTFYTTNAATNISEPITMTSPDGWTYVVPPLAKLQALNLQRGGTPYAEPLDGLSVKRTDDQSNPVEISSSLYLNNSGDFTLTLESPLSKGNAARDRFETTDTGKKVLADIKKLEDAVKGNKVTYTLTNGLPSELHYSGYEPNYDDLTGAILPQPVNTGESYSTVASRYRYDQESLRKSSTEYPDWVTERYLTLPDNFSPAIKAMAEDLTAGAANPYDKTMALVNYLNSLNYTTDPPPVPAGRDEIEFFLMDSKSGYCVHFSSSLALMLRSLGIPTRIATGFIGGDYDAATNSYIVRGSAAHAWTQVYFPGYGWVDFEPTPGREGIQRPVDPSAIPPAPVATPSADSAATASTTPDGSTEQDKGRKLLDPEANANNGGAANSQQSKEFPTWLLVTLSLLLAGGALYFARWYYLKKQFALPDPSPLVVYNRLSRSARKAGLRGRSGMTPFEYADYLCLNLPAAAPSIRAMVNAYVRKRYYPIGEDMDAGQRKKHLEELRDAESKVRKAEAAGHDPRPEDLWVLFRANTDVYKDERQMRALWEDFQETLLAHKREKRINRVTPEFIRKLREWRASRQVKRA